MRRMQDLLNGVHAIFGGDANWLDTTQTAILQQWMTAFFSDVQASSDGSISPAEMTQLAHACLNGDFETARQIQRRFLTLMNVNFVESNPIPVKAGMAMMGLLEPVYRLPLCPPTEASRTRIEKVLEEAGLLRGVRVAG